VFVDVGDGRKEFVMDVYAQRKGPTLIRLFTRTKAAKRNRRGAAAVAADRKPPARDNRRVRLRPVLRPVHAATDATVCVNCLRLKVGG
jgi:hypothetical protein